jgi:hypothetical protein
VHATRAIVFWMFGAGPGIVFVLACGDNLSVKVDADVAIDAATEPDAAPTCDCPATEQLLAGRFVTVSRTRTIAPNYNSGNAAPCPIGSQPIFGSCTIDQRHPIPNVTLRESGFYPISPLDWFCEFRSNEPTALTLRVTVICLKPPT